MPSPLKLDVEYIKVMSSTSTDSVNAFNKGVGIAEFFYYRPSTDSLIFQTPINVDPLRHNTYAGQLMKDEYREEFALLIHALKKYKTGFVYDTTFDGSMYCGPEYYVEFKDGSGVHAYQFILEGDDTLNAFSDFFSGFSELKWKREIIPDRRVNSDFEVVNAMTRLGIYEQRETPYIPLDCDEGIDMNKIYGTWRELRFSVQSAANYRKLTVSSSGEWAWHRIENGSSIKTSSCWVKVHPRDSTFMLISEEGEMPCKVLRLTSNCFEFSMKGYERSFRHDRL